jgi:peptidoglycan/xylan/chitin deacetylase (PgdA/CDA1 family)
MGETLSPRRIVSIILLIAALLLLVDVGEVLLQPSSPLRQAPALPGLRDRPVAPQEARVTQTASPIAAGGSELPTPNPGSTAISQPVPSLPAPLDPGTARPLAPGVVLPALHGPAVVIQRVATTRPYVALTVDDFYTADYHRQTAIQLLQAVNALHAQITLCPAGSALVAYARHHPVQAAEIKRLVAQGTYEFCDHTYSHPVMPKLGKHKGVAAEIEEIIRGAAAIQQFFGRAPSPLFRPPFGSWDASTQQAAAAAGFPRIITWSVDSGDSEGPDQPAQQLVANVACAQRGDIILLHANRQSSAGALPLMITMLRAKGLEPVGLSTLLASGQPVVTNHPADMRRLYTCTRPPAKPVPKRPASK